MANGLDREREVLFIVDGFGSVEIADRLGITTNTVRTHVQAILEVIHSPAAAFAVRHGLVERSVASSQRDWMSREAAGQSVSRRRPTPGGGPTSTGA